MKILFIALSSVLMLVGTDEILADTVSSTVTPNDTTVQQESITGDSDQVYRVRFAKAMQARMQQSNTSTTTDGSVNNVTKGDLKNRRTRSVIPQNLKDDEGNVAYDGSQNMRRRHPRFGLKDSSKISNHRGMFQGRRLRSQFESKDAQQNSQVREDKNVDENN